MQLRDLHLESECELKATRSGGKGGQHVNKVSSRVELSFAVMDSALLSDEQKLIICEKLKNRISDGGLLRIVEDSDRSQHANREKVVEKFYVLLEKALTPVKKRKKTRIPKAVKEKRLKGKKIRGEKKKLRSEKF